MKKVYLILFLVSYFLNAQEIFEEPAFVGEAFIIKADNTILNLEKEQIKLKTKAGLSVYLAGIGKLKTKIDVPGCCSGASFNPDNEIKLIVRAVDNETDPISIIQIFKFEKKKKKRLAELASWGTFTGLSSNNLDNLNFEAKKYGEKSYILTITNFERGAEYGIIVNNINASNQELIMVSTFSVQGAPSL